jgi:hypothetical protein
MPRRKEWDQFKITQTTFYSSELELETVNVKLIHIIYMYFQLVRTCMQGIMYVLMFWISYYIIH